MQTKTTTISAVVATIQIVDAVPAVILQAVEDRMAEQFGGVTVTPSKGLWLTDTGERIWDDGYTLTSYVPRKGVKDGEDVMLWAAECILENSSEQAIFYTYGGVAKLVERESVMDWLFGIVLIMTLVVMFAGNKVSPDVVFGVAFIGIFALLVGAVVVTFSGG